MNVHAHMVLSVQLVTKQSIIWGVHAHRLSYCIVQLVTNMSTWVRCTDGVHAHKLCYYKRSLLITSDLEM